MDSNSYKENPNQEEALNSSENSNESNFQLMDKPKDNVGESQSTIALDCEGLLESMVNAVDIAENFDILSNGIGSTQSTAKLESASLSRNCHDKYLDEIIGANIPKESLTTSMLNDLEFYAPVAKAIKDPLLVPSTREEINANPGKEDKNTAEKTSGKRWNLPISKAEILQMINNAKHVCPTKPMNLPMIVKDSKSSKPSLPLPISCGLADTIHFQTQSGRLMDQSFKLFEDSESEEDELEDYILAEENMLFEQAEFDAEQEDIYEQLAMESEGEEVSFEELLNNVSQNSSDLAYTTATSFNETETSNDKYTTAQSFNDLDDTINPILLPEEEVTLSITQEFESVEQKLKPPSPCFLEPVCITANNDLLLENDESIKTDLQENADALLQTQAELTNDENSALPLESEAKLNSGSIDDGVDLFQSGGEMASGVLPEKKAGHPESIFKAEEQTNFEVGLDTKYQDAKTIFPVITPIVIVDSTEEDPNHGFIPNWENLEETKRIPKEDYEGFSLVDGKTSFDFITIVDSNDMQLESELEIEGTNQIEADIGEINFNVDQVEDLDVKESSESSIEVIESLEEDNPKVTVMKPNESEATNTTFIKEFLTGSQILEVEEAHILATEVDFMQKTPCTSCTISIPVAEELEHLKTPELSAHPSAAVLICEEMPETVVAGSGAFWDSIEGFPVDKGAEDPVVESVSLESKSSNNLDWMRDRGNEILQIPKGFSQDKAPESEPDVDGYSESDETHSEEDQCKDAVLLGSLKEQEPRVLAPRQKTEYCDDSTFNRVKSVTFDSKKMVFKKPENKRRKWCVIL